MHKPDDRQGRDHFLAWIQSCAFVLIGLVGISVLPAWSQQISADLTSQSLEDLMNVQVSSVSKKEEKLSRAAAAVFVITAEDIARSGATNIPDLLRMVPGMDVAQINANTWAISARGFNSEFSNELLVMVDGRTVYVPTFGGVFWDVLDIPLEDIERIVGPSGARTPSTVSSTSSRKKLPIRVEPCLWPEQVTSIRDLVQRNMAAQLPTIPTIDFTPST
jgi:outer membrane receptor for monomeric catechols